MLKKVRKYLFLLLYIIPFLLIYREFFSGSPLAFGDAPYFYPAKLNELFNIPLLWDYRNDNFGSSQNLVVWLYLPTFLMGLLSKLVDLNHEILVRLIFFFPAAVLSLLGAYYLVSKFVQDKWGRILAAFLYGFNNYFLVILDGGQIGLSLAYGLFPLVVLTILNFIEKFNFKSFLISFILVFLISNIDIRAAFSSLVTALFLSFTFRTSYKHLLKCFLILIPLVLISCFYWILPLIYGINLSIDSSVNNFLRPNILDTLVLYHPNFPINQLGLFTKIPFYYLFLPFLILLSLLKIKSQKNYMELILLFLIFAFLAKGPNEPFGFIYEKFSSFGYFGIIFRDSTKFYIPLILIGSLILGMAIESLKAGLTRVNQFLLLTLIYLLLLLCVNPAIFGQMTGTLRDHQYSSDFLSIGRFLNKDSGFFRSLWFPERPPLAYNDWQKPALSADLLFKERPMASVIDGDYDLYYFLHNPNFTDWLRLFGVKYVFVTDNFRKKVWFEKELLESEQFKQFISFTPGFNKRDVTNKFQSYQIDDSSPHIFGVKNALFIVGGEDIYDQLFSNNNFKLSNQAIVFLEDKFTNPDLLENIDPSSGVIVFNNKESLDLVMTYLKEGLTSSFNAVKNEWAYKSPESYLDWKYQLLKNGVDTKEMDFGKGIAYSSKAGEKITFKIPLKNPGKYYLAIRYTNSIDSNGITLSLSSLNQELINRTPNFFKWELIGPLNFEHKDVDISLINNGGFSVFNTVGLIEDSKLVEARKRAQALEDKFETITLDDFQDQNVINSVVLEPGELSVNTKMINPTEYNIKPTEGINWVVFSDHFNKGWELEDKQHFIFYNMFNGFYTGGTTEDLKLVFGPQKEVFKGIIISLAGCFLGLAGLFIFRDKIFKTNEYIRRKHNKGTKN